MADPRFFNNAGPFSIEQVVKLSGAKLADGKGHAGKNILHDVAPLNKATGSELSFLDNSKYIEALKTSKAGACFIEQKHVKHAPGGMLLLVTHQPYSCFARAAQAFYPSASHSPTLAKSPVAASAKIGKDCIIESGSFIGEKVEIGDNCHIGTGVVLYAGVVIGANTSIGAHSTLSHAIVGDNVIIHRSVHIGQDGFGFALGANGHIKVPQLGRVMIGNDVEIGSGTCIDRGSGPDTVIGEGTKIDNLVQIGHNVHIGKYSIIVSQVGISGSTSIGDGVMIGGQAGLAGHLKIGNGARIAAKSGVMTDIPEGVSYGGSPAVPVRDWHRQTVSVAQLAKKKGAEQ